MENRILSSVNVLSPAKLFQSDLCSALLDQQMGEGEADGRGEDITTGLQLEVLLEVEIFDFIIGLSDYLLHRCMKVDLTIVNVDFETATDLIGTEVSGTFRLFYNRQRSFRISAFT